MHITLQNQVIKISLLPKLIVLRHIISYVVYFSLTPSTKASTAIASFGAIGLKGEHQLDECVLASNSFDSRARIEEHLKGFSSVKCLLQRFKKMMKVEQEKI